MNPGSAPSTKQAKLDKPHPVCICRHAVGMKQTAGNSNIEINACTRDRPGTGKLDFFYLFTVYLKHCKELHHLALDKVKAPPLAVGKVPSTESTEKRENPEEY